MSFATLRTSVLRKFGLTDTDDTITTANVNEALNEALQSIATEKDWPWLYKELAGTTAATSDLLDLPDDFARVIFLNVKGVDLTPRSSRDLARYRVDASGLPFYGQPTYYTQSGGNLRISPTPGTGTAYPYVMAYVQTEPVLVADGDEPILPLAFQGWLVVRAALNLAVRTDNPTRLDKLQKEDTKWMGRVIDNVRRSNSISTIRRTKPSVWQDV